MSYQVQSEPLLRTTTRKIKRLELKQLVESGQLQPSEGTPAPAASGSEDRALMESAVGQEVINCLRETYRRDTPIAPNMNLELDLGFDSMEKVELLASLEQALSLELPDDFGAEILTVRDLIVGLEQQAGVISRSGSQERPSWKKILSDKSPGREESFHLAGAPMALLKYFVLRLAYHLLFRTLLRLETRGLKQLPAKGPYLICANHQSYLDPFVLASTLSFRVFRNLFFVGYSVMFTSRIMKLVARLTNIVPVDPDAHLLHAMKAGAYGLRTGRILCIFPEGGRSFDGGLQEFKKGASILSRELSVPIVPVAIQGTHHVWPRDSVRIRPHKVMIEFGEPMLPSQDGGPDPYQQDTDRLRGIIDSMLRNSRFQIPNSR